MKKTRNIIGLGTADDFFKRSRARSKKLDRGEKLQPEMRLMFEDPNDLIRALTTERIRVLLAVRRKPAAVSETRGFLKDGPIRRET